MCFSIRTRGSLHLEVYFGFFWLGGLMFPPSSFECSEVCWLLPAYLHTCLHIKGGLSSSDPHYKSTSMSCVSSRDWSKLFKEKCCCSVQVIPWHVKRILSTIRASDLKKKPEIRVFKFWFKLKFKSVMLANQKISVGHIWPIYKPNSAENALLSFGWFESRLPHFAMFAKEVSSILEAAI